MRPQRKCLGELTSCGKSMRMLLANRLSRCGHMGIRITVPLYNKLQCCPHDRIHLTVFMEFSPCNVLLHDFFLDFSQACHMCMRLSICKRLCREITELHPNATTDQNRMESCVLNASIDAKLPTPQLSGIAPTPHQICPSAVDSFRKGRLASPIGAWACQPTVTHTPAHCDCKLYGLSALINAIKGSAFPAGTLPARLS